MTNVYSSIDLFACCGGLTLGMDKAGFITMVAVEIESIDVSAFKLNHKKTRVIQNDIRKIKITEIKKILNGEPLHLLAGCPPCQGFSSIRKLNRGNKKDKRNNLIFQYLRFVRALKPMTIMMENVPGLVEYYRFDELIYKLEQLGYNVKTE